MSHVIDTHYRSVHWWIIQTYGKATKCQAANCTGKSENYEWAKKHGHEYEKEITNFIQLCSSCHRRYDLKSANGVKTRIPWSERTHKDTSKQKMRMAKLGKPRSENNKGATGLKHSEQSRKKISEGLKGRNSDPKISFRISLANQRKVNGWTKLNIQNISRWQMDMEGLVKELAGSQRQMSRS